LEGGLREAKLIQCFERWLQLDVSSARQWLEKAALPPEIKDRCITAAPKTD
jgi:hypothetical protein